MLLHEYTEPYKILSYYEALTIPEKEYTYLKKLAISEKINLTLNNKINLNYNLIFNKISTSIKTKDLPIIKKEIIIANIMIPDDETITKILTDNNFTLDHLKLIIRFRSILKNYILNNKKLDAELKENIHIYKNIISIILNIFKKELNINNSTIILNRITELIIIKPYLFEEKQDNKKLTKSNKI